MHTIARRIAVIPVAAILALAGCSSDDGGGESEGGDLVIATTNFSETKIIASMYEQVLQANGIGANIKELTTREVIIPALSDGEVDITPEYLGSFTEFLNKQAAGSNAPQVASGDVDATYAAASQLAAPKQITLLPPSAAQNQNAFAVTGEFADTHSLTTLSDLAAYSQSDPIALGGPPECPERPFCKPGLEQIYGVAIESFTALDAGGPLTVSALTQGTVDVGLVFSSSGSVDANGLVLLADDKNLQTAENVLPAVHTPSLTPQVEAALNSVSEALTTQELQQLNVQVDVDRMDPQQVAEDFLRANNLL